PEAQMKPHPTHESRTGRVSPPAPATTARQGQVIARPRGQVRTGTLASLYNRDFRYLLAGTMGANLASWVQTIAQGWLVLQLTGSAVALGVVSFIRGIAMLLASPFGGVLPGRLDPPLLVDAPPRPRARPPPA